MSYIKSAPISVEKAALFARLGFSKPFGEHTVRACEICVVIVHRVNDVSYRHSWEVYMTHGTPGGAFWRNRGPLQSHSTLDEARKLAAELYGVYESGELATIVEG